MAREALIAALMFVSLTSGGCGRSDDDRSPEEPSAQTRAQERDQAAIEMERLRALPYAGYADVEAGEEEDGVVLCDPQHSHPGYNLYIVSRQCRADLIDAEGNVIRSWQHAGGKLWENGELLANGDFLVVGADVDELPYPRLTDDSRYVLRFNWNGELLWKRKLHAHHDVELTPRDQLLMLSFQRRLIPQVHPDIPVRDELLVLLDHAGNQLGSLSLFDLFQAGSKTVSLQLIPPDSLGGEPWVDLFHANSVEWMPHEHLVGQHPIYDPANVLICMRHQNRIAVINWDRKELVWAWGARHLSGPHDAQFLENGNILVLDNGLRGQRSRSIEVDPRTREIVWQYQAPEPADFFTPTKGSNQRLPNGNTLITNSDSGQVFEVTSAGQIVWEFRCPHRNTAGQRATITRTKRYEQDYVQHIMKRFERPEQPDSRPADAQQQAAAIDRLRALPYAGYVETDEEDTEDGVLTCDTERSYAGYNLYVMHERCAAELIDMAGSVVRRWEYPAGQSWGHGELLPNGDLVVVGADPSGLPDDAIADETRCVLRFNWVGELLWKRKLTAHHDIELTPRGQLLTLTFARRTVPEIDPAIQVRDDRLTLLSPAGDVLETLSFYDVLSARPEVFPLARVGPNDTGGERWIDLFHCNSVEWMHHKHLEDRHPIYGPSNVLVCFRHQNRIAVIDWSAKRVLWAWGAGELSGPHDAHVLASGNMLVFDNGMERNWSRVIELDPLRKRIVWEYRAPDPADFFTISKGANQRLPNGNTLITNSDHGQVFEVTPAGEIVWDFRCPHRNKAGQRATIVRLMRYERAYIERIMERFERPAP